MLRTRVVYTPLVLDTYFDCIVLRVHEPRENRRLRVESETRVYIVRVGQRRTVTDELNVIFRFFKNQIKYDRTERIFWTKSLRNVRC